MTLKASLVSTNASSCASLKTTLSLNHWLLCFMSCPSILDEFPPTWWQVQRWISSHLWYWTTKRRICRCEACWYQNSFRWSPFLFRPLRMLVITLLFPAWCVVPQKHTLCSYSLNKFLCKSIFRWAGPPPNCDRLSDVGYSGFSGSNEFFE